MALSLRPAGVSLAVPSPHPRRLADDQLLPIWPPATGLLFPQLEAMVENIVFPVMFGELVIMLWSVIMGAKERALTR